MNSLPRLRGSRFAATVISMVAFALFGCGGGEERTDPSEQDVVEIEPFPSTVMLTDADLADIEVSETDGIIELSADAPSATELRKGRVFVAGRSERTPNGLLRIVKSVETDGDRLRLETLHAPLQLAFRKVHIEAARRSTGDLGALEGESDREPLALGGVGASKSLEAILFDGDGDEDTNNDQIAVNGELSGNVEFEFELDFDWGAFEDLPGFVEDCVNGLLELEFDCSLTELLPEAKTSLVVTPSLGSRLDLEGAAVLDFEKEVQLFQSNLGVLVFGPIVITPNVRILATVEGAASARFATSVDAALHFDTSVSLSSRNPGAPDFQPPMLRDVTFDARPPEVTLMARARAGLGVELGLLVYGVVGPYARAEGYGEIDANVFRSPCVELRAGLAGRLGLRLSTPAILFLEPIDLFDWHADFDVLSTVLDVPVPPCEPPPDASTLPPGAGPDGEHLANPTFEPWSRTLDSVFHSGGAIPGGSTYWIDQGRAIDGRIVVGGRGAEALVKIDENGNVIWVKSLEDANGFTLHPVRTIPTRDAAMLVLAEPDFPPLWLVKVTQSGTVLWSRTLEIPDVVSCGLKPVGLTRDSGDGFFVLTACTFTHAFHRIHIDAHGEVLSAVKVTDPNASGLEATVATRVGDDVFVAGQLRHAGEPDSMFGLRQTEEGELVFARRYVACDEGPDVFPVRAVVSPEGDVTVAGRGGAEHNGFVARLKPNGSVGFASFPGFGFGLGSVFVVDSIAELPTTGYIVGGSSVRLTGDGMLEVPNFTLLQLDAVGKPIWSRHYTLQGADGKARAAAQTDLTLTDDGGILVSGYAQQSETSTREDLWVMKVFARDGHIDFESNKAIASDPDDPADAITNLTCSLSAERWEPEIEDDPGVATVPDEATSVPWAAEVTSQTP
ncbi:MAG: hypothetical protein DIU78_011015 [Pseudomonadota bacterium]